MSAFLAKPCIASRGQAADLHTLVWNQCNSTLWVKIPRTFRLVSSKSFAWCMIYVWCLAFGIIVRNNSDRCDRTLYTDQQANQPVRQAQVGESCRSGLNCIQMSLHDCCLRPWSWAPARPRHSFLDNASQHVAILAPLQTVECLLVGELRIPQ